MGILNKNGHCPSDHSCFMGLDRKHIVLGNLGDAVAAQNPIQSDSLKIWSSG